MQRTETDLLQQHYPTYDYSHRDVVLAEYEAVAKVLGTEERLFINSANVMLLVATALGSLAIGKLDTVYEGTAHFLPKEFVGGVLLALIGSFSFLSIRYFADRQKAILFAKRKIVVLRTMLGLSYGNIQLVLPNWRVEGATNAFSIRLFPGWSSYVAYPFWVVALSSWVLITFVIAHFASAISAVTDASPTIPPAVAGALGATLWLGILALAFRAALYDTHESFGLSAIKFLAKLVQLRMVGNLEYVVYRAKLAVAEASRLGVDLARPRALLLFIEDRQFAGHNGISLRGMARAVRDYVTRRRWSGGSTITQQLVRSLFIEDYHKLWRRKLVEILLALWVERRFSKDQILDLYLAAVRFDTGVYGWPSAMRHYYGDLLRAPGNEDMFFLIERIGNMRGRVLVKRIDEVLKQAVECGLMSTREAALAVRQYERQVVAGTLTCTDEAGLARLREKWSFPTEWL